MRKFLILSIALCSFGASFAYAAPFMETETGIVGSGTDANNFFGLGSNLSGATFTLTITNDPSTMGVQSSGAGYVYDWGEAGYYSTGPVSASLTINGITDVYTSQSPTFEDVGLFNESSIAQIETSEDSANGSLAVISLYEQIPSYEQSLPNFAPVLSFSQSYSLIPTLADSSDAEFRDSVTGVSILGGSDGGSVTSISYGPLTTVPEPLSLMLLGTGLVGLVGLRRKAA